jgi:hypothetical protein
MSKTKNSEEFQRMMDEQELAGSFAYQEKEAEYIAMQNDLAREHALHKAKHYYDLATRDLVLAQDKYMEATANLLDFLNDDYDTDRQDVQDNPNRGYQQDQEIR